MDFSTVIQLEIDARRWTKAELARKAGISKGGLTDVMKGRDSVSFPRLIKIAKALNVDVWRLVKDAEETGSSIPEFEGQTAAEPTSKLTIKGK